jgi:hypothetical protein
MAVAVDSGLTFGKDYSGKEYNIPMLQSPSRQQVQTTTKLLRRLAKVVHLPCSKSNH